MDKLEQAVERLKIGSEASLKRDGRPLVITYSGGKDSDACIEVAKIAGIPFEVVHNLTTADAPETVRHVKTKFNEIESGGGGQLNATYIIQFTRASEQVCGI